MFVFLMILRPPRSTLTETLFPYSTLFRSRELAADDALLEQDPLVEARRLRDRGRQVLGLVHLGDADRGPHVGRLHEHGEPEAVGGPLEQLVVDLVSTGRQPRALREERKSTRLNSSN